MRCGSVVQKILEHSKCGDAELLRGSKELVVGVYARHGLRCHWLAESSRPQRWDDPRAWAIMSARLLAAGCFEGTTASISRGKGAMRLGVSRRGGGGQGKGI